MNVKLVSDVENMLNRAAERINEELLEMFCPGAAVEVSISAKINFEDAVKIRKAASEVTTALSSSSSGRIMFSDSIESTASSKSQTKNHRAKGRSKSKDSFTEHVRFACEHPRTPNGTQMLFDCRETKQAVNDVNSSFEPL